MFCTIWKGAIIERLVDLTVSIKLYLAGVTKWGARRGGEGKDEVNHAQEVDHYLIMTRGGGRFFPQQWTRINLLTGLLPTPAPPLSTSWVYKLSTIRLYSVYLLHLKQHHNNTSSYSIFLLHQKSLLYLLYLKQYINSTCSRSSSLLYLLHLRKLLNT